MQQGLIACSADVQSGKGSYDDCREAVMAEYQACLQ
jgi:hypothetical protein